MMKLECQVVLAYEEYFVLWRFQDPEQWYHSPSGQKHGWQVDSTWYRLAEALARKKHLTANGWGNE